ncbi:DUF544-domain-containing protein, partial [Fistulina hepatica ATCC 64428]
PTTTSSADVWYLKEIQFGSSPETRRPFKIITQNFNGPCSLIAICNVLILRGDIEILPPTRQTVSYDFLSQLVADFLIKRSPDVDISSALSILPLTQKGMDLNPVFTGATDFRPGEGGELKLFEQAGITLVHGWLVDADASDAKWTAKVSDYDTAVALIAEADHLTKGQLVFSEGPATNSMEAVGEAETAPEEPSSSTTPPASQPLSDADKEKIETAMAVREFIDSTSSQLTYHGLFHLASILEADKLYALFRSSHLSVLYKSSDGLLYALATDHAFLYESSVVWERMEDVDGGWSTFVDSNFVRSSPVGGDFAGQTAEGALAAEGDLQGEDDHAHELHAEALRQRREQEQKRAQRDERHREQMFIRQEEERKRKLRHKKDCIVM